MKGFFGFPWVTIDTMHGEEAGRNIKYASVLCKSFVAPVTYTDFLFFFGYLHQKIFLSLDGSRAII